jgi:hypothetical protein
MKTITGILLLLAFSTASGATIYLDADTAATGSQLATTPLVTSLGRVSFFGEVASIGDPEMRNAGSAGNVFDIVNGGPATMTFTFDVSSISFVFGGNSGIFDIKAYDINGVVVDSYYQSDTFGGAFAGPLSLSGAGIRQISWVDPGNSFSAIDNVYITSAVPVPAAVWLFASSLGLLGWKRRKPV